ncbi:MAG: hypothetical protein IJ127_28075, partial [Afipia sp.]|nr:hypothetical protein [Afipia sp.]
STPPLLPNSRQAAARAECRKFRPIAGGVSSCHEKKMVAGMNDPNVSIRDGTRVRSRAHVPIAEHPHAIKIQNH